MMEWLHLPTLNAGLNLLASMLLLLGFICIRRGWRTAHHRLMLGAFGVSTLFLLSYLIYHFQQPITLYGGQGVWRWLYFSILISHVLLAMTVPFLAVMVLTLGLKGKFHQHRRWARFALPIWLYVSVTGVVVYLMLYQMNPSGA